MLNFTCTQVYCPDPLISELHSPLSTLGFIDDRARGFLETAGFTDVESLLLWYPRRYEDRRQFSGFPTAPCDDAVCLLAKVVDCEMKHVGPRRRYFEATILPIDEGALDQPIGCRWFNMPYMSKVFAVDQEVVLYGKPKWSGRRLVIDHPDYEIVEDGDSAEADIHLRRIVPVYRLKDGLPQKAIRAAIYRLLDQLDPGVVPDFLRKPAEGSPFAGMSRYKAMQAIHFPESMEDRQLARDYLALEEFFGLQLNMLRRKHAYAAQNGTSHCGEGELLAKFQASLPFSLTNAQLLAIEDVREGLNSIRPMNRLLQGDVGSGKTFVAMAAALLVVEAGYQAAIMAPTQILAEQHYLVFQKHLDPLGIRLRLHTGSRKEDGSMPLFDGSGIDADPQIIIGTHALLYDDAQLSNLGLAVIDEQHKFGVSQRSRLINKGITPDVLVMTATPIPRTLTMTVYGDLEVSVLDELPAGRGKIVTAVREEPDPQKVTAFLRQHLAEGRQAYLVYPLVEESEKLADVRAVTKEFEEWSERLAPLKCGILHGRMSGDEKDAVMARFRSREVQVLVATTVIEVGVDVPNANIMIIYHSDRFGLAQLHQLRGRIGRGEHDSYCVLVCDGKNPDAVAKLKVLEETRDGFRIAEADLRLRGPGELLGTAQSGVAGLRLGDLVADARLVKVSRDLASEVLDVDPDLKSPDYLHLRTLLDNRSEGVELS
ncbi:MAG: ATP-dependent DNA helicase RecG [Verrucomicrobiales bacterium]